MEKNRIFKKENVITLPNILSFFRIALIPLMIWLYLKVQNSYVVIGVLIISGLTDILDGWIARKYDKVTDVGKMLDPIADKLTQIALFIALIVCYPQLLYIVCLLVVREVTQGILGLITIKRKSVINSAQWHGKLCTVIIYLSIVTFIIFHELSESVVNIILIICTIAILLSLTLYSRFYITLLHKEKEPDKTE